MKFLLPGVTTLLFCFVALSCKKEKQEPEDSCSYSRDIQPILSTRCATNSDCHGAGSTIADYTVFSELKERADNGRIRSYVFDLKIMPPQNFEQLTDEQKEKLECWLDNGAPQD